DGLFAIDIFAGLHGPNGHQRMPVVRRGDRHDIDVFVVEDLPDIFDDFWPQSLPLFDHARLISANAAIDIDHVRHGHVVAPGQIADVAAAAAVDAGDRHVQPFAGAFALRLL